jgi:cytoskeletal protein CcmA (bactofilin family)
MFTSPARRPRLLRAWVAPVVLLIVATIAVGAPSTALGADLRSGNDVTIASDRQINDDLYVTAGQVNLHGHATRDVIVAAGSFDFDGTIDGSLTMLAGEATLKGTIGRSVRVAAGQVEISGPIGGDLVVTGGSVKVTSSGRVAGDLLLAGGNVDVRGTVDGKVQGYAASFTAGGTFNQSVDVKTQSIDVLPTARVTGNLDYTSPNTASIPGSAQIGGQVAHTESSPFRGDWRSRGAWTSHLVRLLRTLIVGAAIVLLFPRASARTANAVRRLLPSLGMGILFIWLLPLIAILLLVTVIGIPLALLVVIAYLIALYLSQVFVGLMIGRFILPRSWDDGTRGFNLLAVVLGVIIITLLKMIPVPFVPTAVGIVVTLLGLGGLVLAVLTRPRGREAAQTWNPAPVPGWT